jgi:hypothetical protein
MDNLQSHIPFILSSMYRGPTILNMAGTEDEEAETTDAAADDDKTESAGDDDTQTETESQTEEESDESEEETDETPAGKAFAKQRAALKAAKAAAKTADEKRIRAEAKAEATEELLAKYGKGKPEETVEEEVDATADINPEDEKVIETYLKKKGIDPNALKNLPQSVQRDQMERQIDKVCTTLEKKYAGSVPFDREKVLKYAVDNGFAAAMPNAPLEKVLELAHKDLNEDALMDWKMEARKKKKDAPTPSGSGTGKKKIVEDQPENAAGFRSRARSRVGSDD